MTSIDEAWIPRTPTLPESATLYEGKVVREPQSIMDTVGVHLNYFRDFFVDEEKWEFECAWTPRGLDFPEEGDTVHVSVNDRREFVVVCWHPIVDMTEVTTQLPLATDWANFDTITFGPATFKKNLSRHIGLEGLVLRSGGSFSVPITIATLPVGYRPTRQLVFDQLCFGATYGKARVDVKMDGVISIEALTSGTPTLNTNFWIGLNGISFRTEN